MYKDFEIAKVGYQGKDMIHYKGLFFDAGTPEACILTLYQLYQNATRVTFDFGNIETGVSWNETYDITGRVHCSMGPVKIPILVHNRRARGGGGILTACILSIRETGKNGRVIYQNRRSV